MGLFNFNKQTPQVVSVTKEDKFGASSELITSGLKLAAVEVPKAKEDKTKDWVLNGNKNSFPKELVRMKNESGLHSEIIESAAELTVGKGFMFAKTRQESDFIYNGLPIETRAKIDQFIKNINPNETANEVFLKWIRDFKIFGYCFMEIIWSQDFTRPVQFNFLDATKMAIGKKNQDEEITHFYYCKDWDDEKKNAPVRIPVFNVENAKKNKETNQIIYLSNFSNGMDYYGLPSYASALTWIKADGVMAETNYNNINNGFSPNVIVKYFNNPTPEQKEGIVSNFKRTMTGVGQKILFLFWASKDDAPTVEPLNVENFNERMTSLNDLIKENIIIVHKANPALMGIQVPGKLGYSNELEQAFRIYSSSVIQPERRKFEEVLTKLFALNGFPFQIYFEDINLLGANENKGLIDTLGVGGVTALKETIVDPTLTPEQKVQILISVFGIDKSAAEQIIKPAAIVTTPTL